MERTVNNRGFTLIELLIVLLIIGIMTGLGLLAFGDFGQTRKLKVAAELLVSYLKIVEEKALIESNSYRLIISNAGYDTYRLSPSNRWEKMPTRSFFHGRSFPPHTVVRLSSVIVVHPSGELSPFRLSLGSEQKPSLFQLSGAHNGALVLEPYK